ncbi:MAG: Ig-like domain-containing protein [Polyangiaceae bacterium]
MKTSSSFVRSGLASVLVALSLSVVACGSSSSGVDSNNGKAISGIDIGGDVTLDKGATQQETATVEYADGTKKDITSDSDAVWNVGDTGVATVSKTGLITGVGTGATTVSITYQDNVSDKKALIVH